MRMGKGGEISEWNLEVDENDDDDTGYMIVCMMHIDY